MLERNHPRARALRRRRTPRGGFSPLQLSKVAGWLRLAVSSQSGGEWTPSIVDVINGSNPVTQTDTDRRAAVGASANGLPTMVFDGSDVHVWPLNNSINNMATKLGFWFWYRPVSVTGVQRLLTIEISAGGASAAKMDVYANNATIRVECYITNITGRIGTTGNILAAGAWSGLYVQYDSSRGGDANLVIIHNTVDQAPLTFSNIGAGGTLTVLPQPTGNAIIGGFNDSDTPTQPIANGGMLGPNLFTFNDNLTVSEIAAIFAFERPT